MVRPFGYLGGKRTDQMLPPALGRPTSIYPLGGSDVVATQESLLARDKIDSGRATAPLVMADGAVHIDTTPYSLDEVIALVVSLVEAVEARA